MIQGVSGAMPAWLPGGRSFSLRAWARNLHSCGTSPRVHVPQGHGTCGRGAGMLAGDVGLPSSRSM